MYTKQVSKQLARPAEMLGALVASADWMAFPQGAEHPTEYRLTLLADSHFADALHMFETLSGLDIDARTISTPEASTLVVTTEDIKAFIANGKHDHVRSF